MGADSRRHLALRIAVAALVCIDLIRMAVEVALLDDPAYLGYGPFASGLEAYLATTTWIIAALSMAGTIRWARRRSTLGGAIALVGLSVLCFIHSHLRGEHDESLFYTGILLGGWLVSEAIARLRATTEGDTDEWGARGALAFLAGSYIAAGLSKVGAASWWDGENLRLALAMATDIYPDSVWLGLRRGLADSTWLTPGLAALTVAVECGGGLLLMAGPRARLWAGAAIWCLHLGIFIALGILFPEPLVLLPLMTWPWFTRAPRVATLVLAPAQPTRWSDAVIALAALAAAAGPWLTASNPAPTFAQLQGPVPVHARFHHPAPAAKASAPSEAPWDRWLSGAAKRQATDDGAGGLAALYRATTGESDARQLWGCDAGYISEGRPGKDRFGCMVSLPGTYLAQALHTPPARAETVDPHAFLMGAQSTASAAPGYDPGAEADEGPPHKVTLSPFWLQRTTVSVRQYRLCVEYGPCDAADVGTGGFFTYTPPPKMAASMLFSAGDERPITGVTWAGATTYCGWVGGRLPTEAEWEYAARGGALQLRYPWGEEAPTCRHAIFGGGDARRCGVTGPASSGSRLTDGHRTHSFILQQAGNVWEWTADWYGAYAAAPVTDPKGPATGTGRVQRGGSWSDDDPTVLRGTFRAQMDPSLKMPDVGFRCAADTVQARPVTVLEDFAGSSLEGWGRGAGEWSVGHGRVAVNPGDAPAMRWRSAPLPAPTMLSVHVHEALEASGSVAVLYGVQDARNHYRAELFPRAGVGRLVRVLDGVEGVIAERTGLMLPTGWIVLNLTWERGEHTFNFGGVAMAPRPNNQVAGEESTWSTGGYGLRVTGPGTLTFDEIFTTP